MRPLRKIPRTQYDTHILMRMLLLVSKAHAPPRAEGPEDELARMSKALRIAVHQ